MARVKKARNAKPKGPLQQMLDRQTIEEATAPLVNRFAEQHGEFERNLRFVVNFGGTTIGRWRKWLSPSQTAGILHCQNLWAQLRTPKLVVDMEATGGGASAEVFNLRQIEALNELHRIAEPYPSEYWRVFENVCRHDLPAGVAGSSMANNKRSSIDAARLIVCFIADMIATREHLSY